MDSWNFLYGVISPAQIKLRDNPRAKVRIEQLVAIPVWVTVARINLDGLKGFFDSDPDIETCAEAFALIGLPEGAMILRLAESLFPNWVPQNNVDDRHDYMTEHWKAFHVLEWEFRGLEARIDARLVEYMTAAEVFPAEQGD